MSQMVKFNLPVIKFRVKSSPSETTPVDSSSPLFKEYSAAPCIFQERLKMKKQIQDSYLRFRKKKKNNYLKQLCSSSKKHTPSLIEKQATILVKTKTNSVLNHLQFTLQVDREVNGTQTPNRRNEHSFSTQHQSSKRATALQRQFLTGSCKEAQKQILFSRNNSLNVSCLQNAEQCALELSIKKCKYNQFNESKKLESYLQANRKGKDKKHASQCRKSSSFQIDPWRADNMSKIRHYFQEEQFQQGY